MLYSIVSYLRESISSIYFLLKRLFLETSLLWSKLPVILTRCTDIFLGWTFTITLWILFTFFFLGILCSQVNFEVFSTLFCEPSCSFLMDESSNFKQWGTFLKTCMCENAIFFPHTVLWQFIPYPEYIFLFSQWPRSETW